jgi:colanic acid biosynthesis glycosyl transferase WcaI
MTERVLLLTQWFDPEPTFKGMLFARELVNQGYAVEVITGFPNYPGGKLYPGYRMRWLQRQSIDGVQVTRVPLYPSHDGSALKRIFNYLSFAITALLYGLFGAKKPDVIYAYHPPLTIGVVAVLLRFFRRIPVVYDVQDMWPDTLRATGMVNNRKLLKWVDRICHWVYRYVDRIVVLSPGFKRLLIERQVPESKIEIIYNWCDEAALASPTAVTPDCLPDDRFNLLFAGTMGKAQALDSVIQAAALLQQQGAAINFAFLGGGIEVDRLHQLVAEQQLTNVLFLPRVPMSEVGGILRQADALLVHLKCDPLFEITIPSKTQAYLSIGKPILMAVPGDASQLIQAAHCGVVAPPEDPAAIAAAALQLAKLSPAQLQQMGVQGQQYYQTHLSLQSGVKAFSQIFDRLIADRKLPPRLLSSWR